MRGEYGGEVRLCYTGFDIVLSLLCNGLFK
jgi:hypothetical protein